MEPNHQRFPRWLSALIAIGCLLAAGIYIGIFSVEGVTPVRIMQSVSFGCLGLILLWGAFKKD